MVAAPVLPAPLVPPNTLQWLALTLTEGLGPTRSKRLVEHFGGVEGIFRASLTELEATGLRATSAQSIFTGKSLDLAQQERDGESCVDEIYPRENKRLAEQILALGGTLISEFSVGTPPTPQNFPIRNRIISGMSVGVLVVEAAEYSGTRITARCALEQSREVFAVPGNVTNKNAWGPNTLIKQGAKLVATWEDVWEELHADIRQRLTPTPAESSAGRTASLFQGAELPPHEKKLLAVLKADESMQIDEIVERLEDEVSPSEIFAALFELELSGKIKQLPGKNFVKTF